MGVGEHESLLQSAGEKRQVRPHLMLPCWMSRRRRQKEHASQPTHGRSPPPSSRRRRALLAIRQRWKHCHRLIKNNMIEIRLAHTMSFQEPAEPNSEVRV